MWRRAFLPNRKSSEEFPVPSQGRTMNYTDRVRVLNLRRNLNQLDSLTKQKELLIQKTRWVPAAQDNGKCCLGHLEDEFKKAKLDWPCRRPTLEEVLLSWYLDEPGPVNENYK